MLGQEIMGSVYFLLQKIKRFQLFPVEYYFCNLSTTYYHKNQGKQGGGGRRYQEQSRKIFIGGLNYNTTEDTLKEHFSQYGELVDIVVMKFPDTKRYVQAIKLDCNSLSYLILGIRLAKLAGIISIIQTIKIFLQPNKHFKANKMFPKHLLLKQIKVGVR